MTKGVKLLIVIVVVAVVAGVLVLLLSPKTNNTGQPSGSSNNSQTQNDTQSNNKDADVTITYDGSSFSLSATTIQSGGTVKVVNTSSKNLEFDSDPHPAHTNNPELNAGGIGPGKDASFTLATKGKWGFHNHLNASQKGELTVE